jgi:hypothetical protein
VDSRQHSALKPTAGWLPCWTAVTDAVCSLATSAWIGALQAIDIICAWPPPRSTTFSVTFVIVGIASMPSLLN